MILGFYEQVLGVQIHSDGFVFLNLYKLTKQTNPTPSLPTFGFQTFVFESSTEYFVHGVEGVVVQNRECPGQHPENQHSFSVAFETNSCRMEIRFCQSQMDCQISNIYLEEIEVNSLNFSLTEVKNSCTPKAFLD